MRKLLLLPLLLISFISFAQKWQVGWGFVKGSTSTFDRISAIKNTYDGNYIMALDDFNFNFVKIDGDGKVIWSKSYGSPTDDYFNDVIQTNDGGFLGVGYIFSSGGNVNNYYGNGDVYVVKVDQFGNYEWSQNYGGSGEDIANSVVQVVNGDFIIGGYSSSTDYDVNFPISGNSRDYWVIRIDNTGNIIWENSYGGSDYDTFNKLVQTTDGNFVLAGSSYSVDFDISNPQGSSDFWIVKIDQNGNILWEKSIGTPDSEPQVADIIATLDGEVIISTSIYEDPTYYPVPTNNYGSTDIYLYKIGSNGNLSWTQHYGGSSNEYGAVIYQDKIDSTYYFTSTTTSNDYDISDKAPFMQSIWFCHIDKTGSLLSDYNVAIEATFAPFDLISSGNDSFIIGWTIYGSNFYNFNNNSNSADGIAFELKKPKVQGRIYIDSNENCVKDGYEYGVRGLKMTIQPGNIVTQTDPRGYWFIDQLPAGSYTATLDTLTGYKAHCQGQINFTVSDPNDFTLVPEVGMRYPENCARPKVSIYSDPLNVCGNNQKIYVHVKNDLTTYDSLLNYAVEIELDSNFQPIQFSEAYSDLGNNTYSIDGIDLGPNESFEITITGDISCNSQINQTLCMKAAIVGANNCVLDTLPTPPITTGVTSNFTIPQPCTSTTWDNSSLEVHGWCEQDSVRFYITNAGAGNMDCYSPVFLYINDNLTMVDSIQIDAQDTVFYNWAAEGGAHVLQVEQHPLHPGKSHPTAFVEYCGNNINQWQGSFTNNLPQNDQDQIVDVHCAVLNTSPGTFYQYGFPLGITAEHLILPNQQMEYIIGFQNTTNDTVHHVVIRDTLDENLNIFSVRPGAQSHPFKFKLVDERILEWTLYNDTVAPSSQGNSSGFVSYSVEQNPNLPDGTIIKNRALVQLGNNAPQQTNAGQHKIYELLQSTSPLTLYEFSTPQKEDFIEVYPNPSNGVINIEYTDNTNNANYQLIDISGKVLQQGQLDGNTKRLDCSHLTKGVYIIQVDQKHNTLIVIQ